MKCRGYKLENNEVYEVWKSIRQVAGTSREQFWFQEEIPNMWKNGHDLKGCRYNSFTNGSSNIMKLRKTPQGVKNHKLQWKTKDNIQQQYKNIVDFGVTWHVTG
jgi:hypothetical protein